MTEHQPPEEKPGPAPAEPVPPTEPKPQRENQAAAVGASYIQYLVGIFSDPDRQFNDKERQQKFFGLITIGALLILMVLSTFFQRVALTYTSGVEFAWFLNGIKFALAYAVPMALALFLLHWYSGRQGPARSLDFFIEKFGAAMALPALLILIAIPLNLLGVTMHGWFRASGLFFIYIAVFMMAYLYAAPGRIQPAVVFALGFYFAYRLIALLL